MGIVNVTPDSFSDGGLWLERDAALAHAERLVEEGADILDIGGESTRPGAADVSAAEEIDRVVPLIEELVKGEVPVSVDTSKPEVMHAALAAGAAIVNDVRALLAPGAIEVVAEADCGVVLMHMQGSPRTMQAEPYYVDVVAEVQAFLVARRAIAVTGGVDARSHCLRSGLWLRQDGCAQLPFAESIALAGAGWAASAGGAVAQVDAWCRDGSQDRRATRRVGRGGPARSRARSAYRAGPRRGGDARCDRDVAGGGGTALSQEPVSRRYFGTDGVRGTVGEAPITPEFVLRLGQAAGRVFAQRAEGSSGRPTILIGKDTRISGYMLEAALEAGLSSAGVDVVLCGPLPTPAVAYLTRALRLDAGIVISASHNPYPDNGIKFFSARGTKLPDEVEARIEAELDQPLELRRFQPAWQGPAARRCRRSLH